LGAAFKRRLRGILLDDTAETQATDKFFRSLSLPKSERRGYLRHIAPQISRDFHSFVAVFLKLAHCAFDRAPARRLEPVGAAGLHDAL
jgi:hypothetical protein